MTVRKLDEDGDIVTQGSMFITEQLEIEQTIRTRLRLFLGEYFRDVTDGTPWFQEILNKQTSMDVREARLRERISGTPGVLQLTSFSTNFDIDNKTYTVTASVLTSYGLLTVTENG